MPATYPSYPDPNPSIDPAVINVAIDPTKIVDILTPSGSGSICTPANFSQLWTGKGQGTVTLSGTDSSSSIHVADAASWIDFVFDQTWNSDPNNANDQHDWRPIGIVFKNDKFGVRGDLNLPMQNIALFPPGLTRPDAPKPRTGSTLRIYDSFLKTPVNLSYYLMVQYSNTQVAMIDPTVVNDTED